MYVLKENTVAQLLQTTKPERLKAQLHYAFSWIKRNFMWATDMPTEKIMPLAKWLIFQHNKEQSKLSQSQFNPNNTIINSMIIPNGLTNSRDYLAWAFANDFNNLKSKLNNPNYTPQNMQDNSENWHVHIASKEREPAAEGRILALQGMPTGWKWVSLDKGYCSKEAKAMGHCGNSGAQSGDNIYSLRDARNVAHLTFIVNGGELGESKGFGNNKPSYKYHPMIIPLLLGKDKGKRIINYIKGGGYKPENNFTFEDLSKEQQEYIKKFKPYINDFGGYIKNMIKTNKERAKVTIQGILNCDIKEIDTKNKQIIIHQDYLENMIEWLKKNTDDSDIKHIPDFEDFSNWDYHYTDSSQANDDFDSYANDKNKQLMKQIIDAMKKSNQYHTEDLEDDDMDLNWAMEEEDDIADALKQSSDRANETGAESDAWDSVKKELDNEYDDEGWTYLQSIGKDGGGEWRITISFDNLKKMINDDDTGGGIQTVKYKYKQPYYGYSGFSEETYNEYLSETLSEILDKFNPEKKKTFKEWLLSKTTQ